MTFDLKKVQTDIFDWVRDYSISDCFPSLVENHIIWADQNGTQPKPPYITLKIVSGPTEVGITDDLDFDESDLKFKIDGLRTMTVSIQAFGSESLQILARLQSSLQFPEVHEYFRSKGLSAYDNTGITDVTTALETIFEQRNTMDVFFYVPYEFETSSPSIASVQVSQEG